ncbi:MULTISPECIES: peroxiredoxin [unclassified Cupriavidus]|uniref:peroxiredoxin n=1 Tax=unclassified Cupriavidus TaxID=2640874 RepID=UPI001AEAA12A|nr:MULTISPECIES: peroxiredoxin [unclassified Cupriavidus]MBP0630223.1 peroxiredoxin [Cupriavidus sp. AcVe19-1a]MBP0638157.1 peroxiredoxin [Cupriavidus sp. AcVe19-6a]
MITVGSRVPDATLQEFIETESEGCSLGPNAFRVADLVRGRKIVVFGLPGAFTPTCSAKHVPGFVTHAADLRAAGVDEVWCVSVNDAFVMGAWGREQQVAGKVRMMADGSAEWTRALGLDQDLGARGMGVRSKRYAMVIDDGVVTRLDVEAPGEFRVSSAEAVLAALRG